MPFPNETFFFPPLPSFLSNQIKSVEVTQSATDYPVTLEQAKAWLKMTGIDDDDAIITQLIAEAVEWVQKFCGISVIENDVVAVLQVKNEIELPYGPVQSITSIEDAAGNAIDPSTITVPGFVNLTIPGIYTVTYTAGYIVVPPGVIGSIYAYIAYAYEHRGDNYDEKDTEFAPVARAKASQYIRMAF